MSGWYGPADEAESIATIHAAIDAGINLLDTGDFYGMGHNEMLLGRALEGRRNRVLLSVKFGAMRAPHFRNPLPSIRTRILAMPRIGAAPRAGVSAARPASPVTAPGNPRPMGR